MNFFSKIFRYQPQKEYNFILPNSSNNILVEENENIDIYPTLSVNLDYLKVKYNLIINSDINVRQFILPIKSKNFSAAIIYIDGIVDSASINTSILTPLLLRNSITMQPTNVSAVSKNISVKRVQKFNLEDFLFNSLIPQNNVKKVKKFNELIEKLNNGFCILLVDTLNTAFCIETKKMPGRSIDTAKNESIIQGPQEAFVENIRDNTGLIRKIINNENLVMESFNVGKITNTQVAICYMKNITNDDLISEVKYRVQNLDIDFLTSSGELQQLIKDNPKLHMPQLLSTERPDKACNALLNGKVVETYEDEFELEVTGENENEKLTVIFNEPDVVKEIKELRSKGVKEVLCNVKGYLELNSNGFSPVIKEAKVIAGDSIAN